MAFIGIDIGSSSIKAGWLELQTADITDVLSLPFPEPLTDRPAGHFEIDPLPVISAVRDLLARLIRRNGPCEGIVTCSQMGGILLVDPDGKPLTNYLSWRDQRTLQPHPGTKENYLDLLRRRTSERDWEVIGHELKPGGAPSLLFWLAENDKLPSGPALALSLGDFVLSRICAAPPVSEPTLALGLIDLSRNDWHRPWFEKLGFGSILWPELRTIRDWAGKFPSEQGLIPCAPAVGDHQAALFGTDLVLRELSVNASTGAQVSLLSESWKSGDYQTRPYFGNRYLNTVTHLPAGRSLNALVDLLTTLPERAGQRVEDPWTLITRELERTPRTDLEVDLAFFASAVGDRGSIDNVRLENLTVGHLFRASLENMARNFSAASRRLGDPSAWDRTVLSGGICQKLPLLRDLLADEIPGPQRTVQTSEETLLGLLKLARHISEPA